MMMVMKYRDHRDIIAAILETLSSKGEGGTTIVCLMYGARTAWNGLLDLLDFSIERGLITKKIQPAMTLGPRVGTMVDIVGPRRNHYLFFITEKGIKFLHLYKQLKENLK